MLYWSMTTNVDPTMRRFRAALDEAYGNRIERVVLFGSRARGDARPDSDYDVAVFLKDMKEFGREVRVGDKGVGGENPIWVQSMAER